MSNINYNDRQFINASNSHFTGSIVCFDGTEVINQGKLLPRYTFVEIASCHSKVRIHKDDNLSMEEYISKLRVMEASIRRFANFLEDKI